jgi:anti-anti-sigma factor
MKIATYSKDSIMVVGPQGRIDSESAPDLEKTVLAMLQRGDRYLILDMSQVEYMASSGMRVLLLITKKCQAAEATLVLSGLVEFVRELLSMTGFLQYFQVFDSVDAAVAHMTS